MAYNLLQLLVPARFLLTFGHLVPTLMMILTRKENIMAALPADPSDGQIKRAKDEFEVAYTVILICFALDVLGIFMGTSLFFPKVNLLQAVCHFAGGCFISSMIAQSWQYQYVWCETHPKSKHFFSQDCPCLVQPPLCSL
mmetsp:Transcript_33013/g.99515  ORF Transcript_33013/g.99515 Transcript_33013/m.99515 type:complete len:140 (-) Transcript_33013:537-956(-)